MTGRGEAIGSDDWTRRGVLRAASAAVALGGLACSRSPGSGVVLLVADDLGRGDLGCLGNRFLRTPQVDGLASEGMVLHRAYTPSALCRPSRAAMLSGLSPHRTGRSWYGAVREDLELWPEHFRRAGCVTGIVGKTAVAKNAHRWGFCEGGEVDYATGRDPGFFAGKVGRFLDLAGGRPFALVVNFFDPHRGGPAVTSDPSRTTATRAELARIEPPPWLADTDDLRIELRNYRRDVARLDRAVGAVLDVLRERGADGGLTLFTSDNGSDFPFAKATLYEAGVNMPLVARWPGVVEAGSESRALISFVDLLPTCLAAGGASAVAPPAGIEGRSFLPVLAGAAAEHRDVVFCEHDEHRAETATPSRAVVDRRHKYMRHFRLDERFETAAMRTAGWMSMVAAAREDAELAARIDRLQQRPREELYDLEADPWELVDLAGDPARGDLLASLRGRLRAWMESEGDPLLAEWDA